LRLLSKSLIAVCLAAALAIVLAACGDKDVTSVKALEDANCGEIEYDGKGQPDALIASDLPKRGASRERTEQMVEAIRIVLEQNNWSAGDTTVALQSCDDSSAKTGEWTPKICKRNARDYASNPDVIGVLGTYNSGCAAEIIPILNKADDGGVAMVSPGNTLICLTQSSSSCPSGDPDRYYPTGKRNYARVVPNDAVQGAGLAEFASRHGIVRPYVLYAGGDPVSKGQGTTFRGAAGALGLQVAGFESWDPDAKSYTDVMNRVQASGADAVLLAGLLEQNGPQLIKDKVSVLGPNGGAVKLLAPDGFAQQATIDDTGKASKGMFISVPGRTPDRLPAEGADLVNTLKEDFPDSPVELYAPYAGQAAQVMLDSIEAGGKNRAKTIDALFNVEVKHGIVGSFKVDASGDPSVGPITVSVAKKSLKAVDELVPAENVVAAARG